MAANAYGAFAAFYDRLTGDVDYAGLGRLSAGRVSPPSGFASRYGAGSRLRVGQPVA